MLLVPTALAAPTLEASALSITGASAVRGDAAAVYAESSLDGASWELTAASGHLVRLSSSYVSVVYPVGSNSVYTKEPEWTIDEEDVRTIAAASTGIQDGGAMLVLAREAELDARSEGLVRIASQSDPSFVQNGWSSPADVDSRDGEEGFIREELPGDYLNVSLSEGVVTIRGSLTLILYGPAYDLIADGAQTEERTGEFETSRTAVVSEGHMERHEWTLEDAVLTLHAPEGALLFTTFPEVAIDGRIQAESATGALRVDGAEVEATDGTWIWTGATTLSLAPTSGRILATTPEPLLATGAAIAPATPLALAPFALALALVLALGTGAILLYRRRSAGDLDAALVAMEERRWEDALPHLTRLAKKEPTNAGVQIDRALCLEQVGRFEDAAKAFEAALRSAPQHAEAHFYYARTLAKMRESEAARVHLEAALERDPRLVEMARTEKVLRGL